MGLGRVEFSNIFFLVQNKTAWTYIYRTDMVIRSIQGGRSQSGLAGWVSLCKRQDRWV